MAREEIVRCDVCGKTGSITTWSLGTNGSNWSVDLCKSHSKPLTEIVSHGREIAVASTPRSSSLKAYDRALRPGG